MLSSAIAIDFAQHETTKEFQLQIAIDGSSGSTPLTCSSGAVKNRTNPALVRKFFLMFVSAQVATFASGAGF